MKHIADLTEENVLGKKITINIPGVESRKAARGILINENNQIGIMNVKKRGIYKLPGGGVEEGETIEEALRREVIEEAGWECEILEEVGTISETRNYPDKSLKQTTYCYLVKAVKDVGQNLMADEIKEEFTLEWMPIDEAINKLKNCKPKPDDFGGFFIAKRERLFLEEAQKLLN